MYRARAARAGPEPGSPGRFGILSTGQLRDLLQDEPKLDRIVRLSRKFQGLQLERDACLASNYALAKENLALRPRLEMGRTALAIKYQELREVAENCADKLQRLDPDGAAAAGGTKPGGLPASLPEGPCPGPPEADPGRETTGSAEASGTFCPAGSHYCCCCCCRRHRHGSPETLPCCCRPAHWGRPGTTSSRTPEPASLGLPPSAPTEGLPRVPFWPSPSAEPSTLSA
ncbi:vacuolar protein sorting-associated protein 37D isoform X2 [Alexandromys fortis]|uniref:vacuolar protein sorting-associated protein 37D isoform X2 n=1 Tax=Alexandromys fortis TaxID=100897 RepID=UPI0021535E5E|nr:vacuolar protein sorting-associated protein 37D isoform X2 [Microtus fortis]